MEINATFVGKIIYPQENMATKIVVREATREDAAMIALAVAIAIGDEVALRDYCGDDYLEVLTEIAQGEATQYSYNYALIAEVNGKAVGAVVGYDGVDLYKLREGTFAVLRRHIEKDVANIVDETEAGEYYLDSVGVLPDFQGQGVGKALVAAFCDKVFAAGHKCVGLIVDSENPDAERLYTSLGFKHIGTKLFFGHNMWHLQKENNLGDITIRDVHPDTRDKEFIAHLTELWEGSVRATHHFLSEEDIAEIREYVPLAIANIPHLMVATDEAMRDIAFIGIEGHNIEMLFVAAMKRGIGVGRKLIEYATNNFKASEVTVNEQNPQAIGFYEHLGFTTYKRSDHDEQGRPLPLLYMRL